MSNTFQPRMRGHMPTKRFADQAKAAKAASTRAQFKRPDGLFDRLKLGEKPIWLRISPEQLYTQEIYDRQEKKVVEVTNPWFEHVTHFVPSRERSMICSAGAHRDQPCRGCSIRTDFYNRIRAQEQATQVKDEKKRKSPPVQAATRYGMAVTVIEKIFSLPQMGKGGKPKTNRDGQTIMTNVPAPLSGLPLLKQKEMEGTFGYNFHWGFGTQHLAQLADIDQSLWNICGNCANDLMATEFHCVECQAVVYSDENGVVGSDLRAVRENGMKCGNCGFEGFTQPLISCTGCTDAKEGSLLSFDLQIRLVPVDEKNTDIKMEKYRVPDYVGMFDGPTAERITELVYCPLDIPAICAPDSVDRQAFALPEELKAISPSLHLKEKTSQPYGQEGGEGEGGGDPDQMSFGES